MSFFEYNLPSAPPNYLHPSILRPFGKMLDAVKSRMDKLEDALEQSGLPGEAFSVAMKPIFASDPERFDALPTTALSDMALYLGDKLEVAPRMEWAGAETVVDTTFVTNEEWAFMARRLGIGGADSATAQGRGHFGSKIELYHNKIGSPELITQESPQAIFDRGHLLEPKVIGEFCRRSGAVVVPEPRMFRSKTHPHCLADIDAILRFPDGHYEVFEAKSTKSESQIRVWSAEKVPEYYLTQCRQYPGVLNDPRITATHIGCLFVLDYILYKTYVGSDYDACEFVSREIPRSETEEKALLDAEEEFWQKYIEAGEPPEPSAPTSEGAKNEIEAVMTYETGHAKTGEPPVLLDYNQLEDKLKEWESLKGQAKELKDALGDIDTRQKQLQADFIRVLDGHIAGECSGADVKYVLKNSPIRKTEVDKDKLKADFPEAYSACVDVNPHSFYRFSIKTSKA